MSLILYFVTSSDSGSLVIDCLTSNGNPHPPIIQRVFWSFTEGAVAMTLLFVGGQDSLTALQAVSIVAGVPYTVVVCFMCKSLWSVLSEEHQKEFGEVPRQFNEWRTGVIDVLDYPTFSAQQAIKTAAAIFVPFYYSGVGAGWVDRTKAITYQVVYGLMFVAWVVLLAANPAQRGLWAIGWVFFVAYTLHTAYVRNSMRTLRVRTLPPFSSGHRAIFVALCVSCVTRDLRWRL